MEPEKTVDEIAAEELEAAKAENEKRKAKKPPGADLPPIVGTFSMKEPKDGWG